MPARRNLHLFLSPILAETRLFKEVSSLLDQQIFEEVRVFGLWEAGLNPVEKHVSGLKIERLSTFIKLWRAAGRLQEPSILRKILAAYGFIEYCFKAIFHGKKFCPSHVSVHNAVLLPVGYTLSRLVGAKLIYVPHELESEKMGLSGSSKKLIRGIENIFIDKSAAVVTVCDPISDWYKHRYHLDNVFTIRNMPSLADVKVQEIGDNSLRKRFGVADGSLLFIYQGVIDRSRGVYEVINFFKNSMHHVVFMGYGGAVEDIQNVDCSNIHYQPAVSKEQITSYTATADVGIFLLFGDLPLSYVYSLPNKFFEYMHAGNPIIVSKDLTYLSGLVEKLGVGESVGREGIAELIGRIDAGWIESKRQAIAQCAQNSYWELDAASYSQVYR